MMLHFRFLSIISLSLLFLLSACDPTQSSENPYFINLATLTKNKPTNADLVDNFLAEKINLSLTRELTRRDIDVTGDNQFDILLGGTTDLGWPFLAIFSRTVQRDSWQMIFYQDDQSKYASDIQLVVDDNLVIADFLTTNGGTGFLEVTWRQRWIACQQDSCTIIWDHPLLSAWRHGDVLIHTISQGYEISEVKQITSETLELTIREFALQDIPSGPTNKDEEVYPYPAIYFDTSHLVVGPVVEQVYQPHHGVYEMVGKKRLTPSFEIMRYYDNQTTSTLAFVSLALSRSNDTYDEFQIAGARLWGLPVSDESNDPIWGDWQQDVLAAASDGYQEDGTSWETTRWVSGIISALDRPLCRLMIHHYSAGDFVLAKKVELPCIGHFTRLDHADIDNDGRDELLLLTVLPGRADTQRLHIFSVGKEVVEVAQLDGFIHGPDMAGVRWEQNDDAFQVLTGLPLVDWNCGSLEFACIKMEPDFQIYEWQIETEAFQLISKE